jgi:hypothetical protein
MPCYDTWIDLNISVDRVVMANWYELVENHEKKVIYIDMRSTFDA